MLILPLLPYKVKTQYVHLLSIADTSIKCTISLSVQFHSQAKKLYLHMFDNLDIAFNH